jgi:hypothetical protein
VVGITVVSLRRLKKKVVIKRVRSGLIIELLVIELIVIQLVILVYEIFFQIILDKVWWLK